MLTDIDKYIKIHILQLLFMFILLLQLLHFLSIDQVPNTFINNKSEHWLNIFGKFYENDFSH